MRVKVPSYLFNQQYNKTGTVDKGLSVFTSSHGHFRAARGWNRLQLHKCVRQVCQIAPCGLFHI